MLVEIKKFPRIKISEEELTEILWESLKAILKENNKYFLKGIALSREKQIFWDDNGTF